MPLYCKTLIIRLYYLTMLEVIKLRDCVWEFDQVVIGRPVSASDGILKDACLMSGLHTSLTTSPEFQNFCSEVMLP